MIDKEFSGDAAQLWQDRPAKAVQDDLMRIHGVGSGIAAMTVIWLHQMRWEAFPDPHTIPVKPDVHVQRVMYRTGLADEMTEKAATCAAQRLNPHFPGELDCSLWVIGREWCLPAPEAVKCGDCPMGDLCPKVGLQV